ncbi:MAG: hypothetical protein ACPG21_01515 [Crocinitomicaceae bacterium]
MKEDKLSIGKKIVQIFIESYMSMEIYDELGSYLRESGFSDDEISEKVNFVGEVEQIDSDCEIVRRLHGIETNDWYFPKHDIYIREILDGEYDIHIGNVSSIDTKSYYLLEKDDSGKFEQGELIKEI